MKYDNICRGIFIERPNRFVAFVEINGKKEKAHVKNTGRCRELLIPGAVVYLEDHISNMGSRKLRYSLITVEKTSGNEVIPVNIDSQAPNRVVREALENGKILPDGLKDTEFIKGEYVYGASRIDFYVRDSSGKEALLEVKGVTLEKNGDAMFPDAPTERGIKHINELVKAVGEGYTAAVIFIIQMKGVRLFTPNYGTHAAFGEALRVAERSGVGVLAYDCEVESDSILIGDPVSTKI